MYCRSTPLMSAVEKFKYKFDKQNQILFKYYFGDITIEDLKESWLYAFKKKIIPKGTKSFILDYRESNLHISPHDAHLIAEFYREHLDVFAGSKIAIIVEQPVQIVVPMLVQSQDKGYISRPFTTIEAAIEWLTF